MRLGLVDKVAVVTGGSRGIGAALVRGLVSEGVCVAFNHLGDGDNARSLVEELEAAGGRVLAIESDVADPDATEALFVRVEEELGPVSILVNNAGITRDGVVWKMEDSAWDAVLGVNLKGSFNFCRSAAVRFRARGGPGRIVNVASINGLRGKFGQVNYSASKGGIIAMSKTLARELGRFGVTVNALAPGMVLTPMAEGLPEAVLDKARAETVLGRLAAPGDIADCVLFLVSDRARHITGQCIQVDGGQLM